MKILVVGAGVLGSLYSARLKEAGNEVTILARGQRLADIREHGLVLEEAVTGKRTVTSVPVIETVDPEETYDWVLVVVRRNQVRDVLPLLARHSGTPNVLFLLNNAAGPYEMVRALGRERVVLGFPGGGGERVGPLVRYQLAGRVQPTTIGEISGQITPRLEEIQAVLEDAGLPVALSTDMDAWLKTHVALVSPIANALYMTGGDNYRLARTRDALILLVRAVREGFQVLNALGIPITPARYRLLSWIPEPILVALLRRRLPTKSAELNLARHANAARDEMKTLADEFHSLAHITGVPTPAIDWLYAYTDLQTPIAEDGQRKLVEDWREVWIALWALTVTVLGSYWMVQRMRRRRSS